jgi:hypothetical protein
MCSTLHCIRRKLTEIGDVLQGGSVTMAHETTEVTVAIRFNDCRPPHDNVLKVNGVYIHIRKDEEIKKPQYCQTVEAG